MAEWKRVLLAPRRLFLLALMTAFCAGAFVLSLLDRIGPGEFACLQQANAYAESLVTQWQGQPLPQLLELAQAKLTQLEQFDSWYQGYTWYETPFESAEQAYAAVAEYPGLAQAAQSGDAYAYYRAWASYQSVVDTLAAELRYLEGYAAYLEGVQTQAQLQSQTSLFGKSGSFSRRNLAKTAQEFAALQGVQVTFGNNRGLERWLAFELGDYFHLVVMVITVLAFLEERKKGLWPLVRTTRGGRARLGVIRVGILLAASLAATLLFSGLPLLLSLGIHGGWGGLGGLGRALQSLESFKTCTLRLSVAGWLPRYFGFKCLCGVLIGLFLWCVLGSVANIQFALSVLGAVLVGEYALYALLPVQSIFNALKYLNIFAYVHTAKLYTQYLNVDLLGFPVGVRALAVAALILLGAAFTVWAVCLQQKRRPDGNVDLLGRLFGQIDRLLDVVRVRFSLGVWEGYKAFIFQYGVLVLAVVVLVGSRLNFIFANTSTQDAWYLAYVQDMEGPLDADADRYLERARQSIPPDAETTEALTMALFRVENRVATLRARAQDRGYTPWMVEENVYDQTYGPQSRDLQRLNAAAAIVLTAFCCVGLFAFERQCGMVALLRATKRGRKGLLRCKAALAAGFAAFVWAAVYMRELWVFLRWRQPQTLAAPVQNLDGLAKFPLGVTLAQYLALLYAIRLVMLLCVAAAALLIGFWAPNVQLAYLAAAGLLGLPALLTVLGFEPLKWISPLLPVAAAELLWGLGGGNPMVLLPWLAWLAAGAAALWLCRRRWVQQG